MRKLFVFKISYILGLTVFLNVANGDWVSFLIENPSSQTLQLNIIEDTPAGVILDVIVPGMEVEETIVDGALFQKISIPDYLFTKETGKPRLPVIGVFLAVPNSVGITTSISDSSYTVMSNYNIYPVPDLVTKTNPEGLTYIDEEFAMDSLLYTTDTLYPGHFTQFSIGGIRGQRVVHLMVYPIQYNPATKELRCYSYLRIRLNYSGTGSINELGTGPFEKICENVILNYKSKGGLPIKFEKGTVTRPLNLFLPIDADYLIIAHDSLYGSSALDSFAQWKAEYDSFDVAIVKESDICGSVEPVPNNADTLIRDYIQYAYYNWYAPHMPDNRLGYVLLVGDVRDPYRKLEEPPYGPLFLPWHKVGATIYDLHTDNWYACVDTNPSDDLPDLMVGRFSVLNPNELSIVVNKTITFESTFFSQDWRESVLLICGFETSDIPLRLRDTYDYIKEILLEPAGYNVDEIYSAYIGSETARDSVIDYISQGQLIVSFRDHGSPLEWGLYYNGYRTVFFADDVDYLTNQDMYPFIFAGACYTAYLDYCLMRPNCIAEVFVKAENKGAIAYLGASRGSTSGGSNKVCKELFRAFFEDYLYQVGQIMVQAKLRCVPLGSPDVVNLHNLLGDPSLDLSGSMGNRDKADLAIGPNYIRFDPEPLSVGSDTIIAKVKNIGAADAFVFDVEFYDGNPENSGILIAYDRIYGLVSGDSAEASVTWNTTEDDIGWHDIYVVVDPDNLIDEAFEGNNQNRAKIWVYNYHQGFPVSLGDKICSSPVLVDLDGDELKEIIIGSNSDTLYVFHQDGSLMWKYGVGQDIYSSPAVADLDRDGDMEIVVGSGDGLGPANLWAFNAESGTLFWDSPITMGTFIYSSPALGDIDNDDSLEIAIGLAYEVTSQVEALRVLDTDGSTLWSYYSSGCVESSPALGDLNGNGLLDVVFTLGYPADSICACEDTTGSLLWKRKIPRIGQARGMYYSPSLADLNGDGDLEVLVPSPEGIFVLNGSTGDSIWANLTYNKVKNPVIGDIDGDGDLEIVVATYSPLTFQHSITVLDTNGIEIWSYPVLGDILTSPIIADVGGDSRLEILVGTFGVTTIVESFGLYILNHDGTPYFSEPIPINNGTISSCAVGDIDDDGLIEVVLGGWDSKLHVFDFWGNPTEVEWGKFRADGYNTGNYHLPPLKPVNLQAMVVYNGSPFVNLNWTNNTETDLAGYNVYRKGTKIATTYVSNYSDYPIPGKYTYYVTAFDFCENESEPSNSDTVEILPYPPVLSGYIGGDYHAHLSWTFDPGDWRREGYTLYGNSGGSWWNIDLLTTTYDDPYEFSPLEQADYYVIAHFDSKDSRSNTLTLHAPGIDPVIAESNFDAATGYNNGKRIVVDGNGRIHIYWCSLDSVYYSYTDDGENFVTEAVGSGQFGTIDLYEGKPILSWIDAEAEESAIYLSRLTDEGWEEPILLYSNELKNISAPSMNIVSNIAFFAWAEKEKGIRAPWDVYTGTLDLTGSSLETTLIEQFTSETDVLSPSITESVTGVSLIYDRNEEILYREYDGSSWSEAQVLSTPEVFASHPSISSYGDRTSATWQEEVWPGIYNIYYTSKLLDGDWEEPVRISTSRHCEFPVTAGPILAWAEEISDSIYTVYAKIPYEFGYSVHSFNLSGTSEGSNAYPNIAFTQTCEGTELHTVWTQKIEPLRAPPKYAGIPIEPIPTFSENVGQSEPSVYLVQREGYMNYGYWAHQSIDYHLTELKYHFTNLSPEKEYTLGITFYYESEDSVPPYWVQQPIVDSIPLGAVRIEPGTPETFEKSIENELYQDSVLDVSIRKLVGNYAVCAAIYLYEFDTDAAEGGGAMSASTYRFLPKIYRLFQNYPNPYTSMTTIRYHLPKKTKVSLKIYNQAGQLVRTLVKGAKRAGAYTTRWDGKDKHESDLPSGVYFYRLETGDFTSTKKIVLIR